MAYSDRYLFIKKISEHSGIRQDVVEIIINSMVDVMIDEIVNKGKFSFLGLFHIKAKEWKGYSFGDEKNENKVDNHSRLTISMSKRIRQLWKIRFDKFDGDTETITKDNWKEIYYYYIVNQKNKKSVKKDADKESFSYTKDSSQLPDSGQEQDIASFNPFLDDDDEF